MCVRIELLFEENNHRKRNQSSSSTMSMYIKLKRQRTTFFIHCEKDDTIKSIKEKIQAINKVPVDRQAIYVTKEGDEPLSDDTKLADAKIYNDSIVYLVFKDDDDNWEPISIANPSDTQEEEDDLF
jgi:transcription elongation factor B subunit 2